MPVIVKKKYLSRISLNTIAYLSVFVCILIGYVFGIYKIGFGVNQTINILIFSLVSIFLSVWSFLLYSKARDYEKTISRKINDPQTEIEKSENALDNPQATNQKFSNTSGYFDRIIDESTDLISAIDSEYRHISFNNSFKEMMAGYFNFEVINGIKLEEILAEYPIKLQEAKELWDRALGGETFSAEQFFSDDSGEIDTYEASYAPIRNRLGEIVGASQIARNVTEKNLEALKIKRERDFAASIFDANKSMILVIDRDGRIIRFNHACENISGYNEEEIKGRVYWNVLIPTDDIAKIKHRHRNIDWTDLKPEYINRWITKNEETKTISWQLSAVKDSNGTIDYIVASGIDITEKRESDVAKKRMLEILENSTDFISITNMRGQIMYLNSAGKQMLGIQEDSEFAPIKTSKCHPKWVNEKLDSQIYPMASKEGTWLGETALTTLNGEEIPTSQLVMVHKDEKGNPEYFSSVIRDISQKNRMSQELQVAKENATKHTQTSSVFLANMSHEIRTPMNGVIGLAELLLDTELNEEQKDYVETIQRSGDSLLAIINDTLDFSKLESNMLQLENVDFDLHETIESTFDIFSQKVTSKHLELCLNIHKNVPSALRGDPGRLIQVLNNFIGNAVKFTDKGEIIVTVKVVEDGTNPTLHFAVEDTGIGVSAKAIQKLFNPFIQADSSITKRFGGTGLGLAISKQFITKMNGDLGATSEKGVGSTFWFTAQFEAQAEENQRTFNNPAIENVRTLIVDDNIKLQQTLQSLTKSWGMVSDVAESGAMALNLMNAAVEQGEAFELVIVDSSMPQMNGYALIDKIRNSSKLRKSKIILMSSQHKNKAMEVAQNQRISSFIEKPIKQTKLFSTLIDVISNEQKTNLDAGAIIATASETQSRKITDGASTMNLVNSQNHRILIAEDNLVNQKVILSQVSGLGYEVDLAENGNAALDALQLKEYSLILMDCQMPVMDGFTATQKIRENEIYSKEHIPIIAVTAHAIEGDKEKCLSAGMDDYITKPTKQQALSKAIEYWLSKTIENADGNTQSNELNDVDESKLFVESKVKEVISSEAKNINERLFELAETCGNETVMECISLFLNDTDSLIDTLEESVQNRDFTSIAIEAHKLKGSSANMGATRLPKFALKLMSLAKEEKIPIIDLIMKQIVDDYNLIKIIYLKEQKDYEKAVEQVFARC